MLSALLIKTFLPSFLQPQRSVTVQEIEQLMVDKGGQAVSAAAVAQLEEAIVRAMFMLESTANHRDADNRYAEMCSTFSC